MGSWVTRFNSTNSANNNRTMPSETPSSANKGLNVFGGAGTASVNWPPDWPASPLATAGDGNGWPEDLLAALFFSPQPARQKRSNDKSRLGSIRARIEGTVRKKG